MKSMKKLLSVLCLLAFNSLLLFAQTEKEGGDEKPDNSVLQFLPVYDRFSSKESIVKLKDGRTIKGINEDLDRKKGQINSIEIKDSATGKKTEYKAALIDEMYLFPSGFDKMTKRFGAVTDIKSYTNKNLDQILNQGYCYFKNQAVSLKNKKKEKQFLMQLVNPDFSTVIQVYGDAMAKSTASIGIGPMKAAGGIDKSFYVKKGEVISWLKKSEFEENYLTLFGDNKEFLEKYPKKDAVWRKLNLYVYEYTRMTEK
jgi:hypothetical protein